MSIPLSTAVVRPELQYAWYGPALLVTNERGECGDDQTLSGFYFRETRFLRELRLEINGQPPWLCASGTAEPRSLTLGLSYPELHGYSGGGSGSGGDDVPRDQRGIPNRALDLLARYELSFRRLVTTLLITNRTPEDVTIDLAWCVGADFADLMEALEGGRREELPVTEVLDHGLHYRLERPDLAWRTDVEAAGAGQWTACPGKLVGRLTLPSQRSQELRLTVTAQDVEPVPDAAEEGVRRWAADRWREEATRFYVPGDRLVERMVSQAVTDLGSFALLEGSPEEWLAPSAGMPLYPALFGRDSLTTCWQAALLDRGRLLRASMTRLERLQ